MRFLLLISIGPVQEFIASARRTRDLWFGSWVLSEIAREVAQTLQSHGGKLIFPFLPPAYAPEAQPQNVANRILAEITLSVAEGQTNPAAVHQLGETLYTVACERLLAIRDQAFTSVAWPNETASVHKNLAQAQVAELLECTWVAVPFPESSDYGQCRNLLEELMAARKATRTFGPSPVVEGFYAPKSSIDGTRESVIPENLYLTKRDRDDLPRRKTDRLYRDFGAGQAERLSGVDLLKRHGQRSADESTFPSTSHFAALPFLLRLPHAQSLQVREVWNRYLMSLRSYDAQLHHLKTKRLEFPIIDNYDASLLFEERLSDIVDQADLAEAQGHLRDFLIAVADGKRPEPYYALLVADGDRMGKVIDHQTSPEDHRMLSQTLSGFADDVRSIVESERHRGALIYAGGDDVLAFLPLSTNNYDQQIGFGGVLGCARELANDFKQRLQAYTDQEGKTPTLSVGIAICHHLEPLSDALNLARRAERRAKQQPEKNALAITVSKRSGVDRTICGAWDSGFYTRLTTFIGLHRSEALPDGAAYDLRDLAERLTSKSTTEDTPSLALAMRHEAIRILKRKRGQRGGQEVPLAELNLVRTALGLPSEPGKDESSSTVDSFKQVRQPPISVLQLADELIVAREFARAAGSLQEQQP